MFIDYNKLSEMVDRMEQVAASMEKSVERFEESARAIVSATGSLTIQNHITVDGHEVANNITKAYWEKAARR